MEMKNPKDKKTNDAKREVTLIDDEKKTYFKVIEENVQECKVYDNNKIKLNVMCKYNYKDLLSKYVKEKQRERSKLVVNLVNVEQKEVFN